MDIFSPYSFLLDILPEKEIPKEIVDAIDLVSETNELIHKSFQYDFKAADNAQLILDSINQHRLIYEEYFAGNLFYFEQVLINIINHEETFKARTNLVEFSQIRDKKIYDNFLAFDNILPNKKYFGQWGLKHALQSEMEGVMWFASYLNTEDSKYEDKVLTIAFNYLDCESMGIEPDNPIKATKVFSVILENQYYNDEKYVLYKINSSEMNRPDINKLDLFSDEETDKDMSEYFQYILLIQGSEATEHFGD